MSKPAKILLFTLISTVIAALLGQIASAYIFKSFTGMPVPIGVGTMYDLYQVSNGLVLKQGAYLFSAVLGVLFPIAMVVMVVFSSVVKPKRELHGSARFANLVDIRKAKLLEQKYEEPDILIGKWKGKYLRWPGKEFCYLAAPTRTGKGVGIVIPNCLHYRDSLVVFDPKLENFDITAGYRKQCGQEVFLFNPSTKEYKSHRWNPLSYVPRDPDFTFSELQIIANILLPTSGNTDGNSKFFNGMAQQLFVGLGLYLIETEKSSGITPTITGIISLSLPKVGDLPTWIKKEVLRDDISEECKRSLLSFASASSQTQGSILASMQEPLSIFNDPIIAEITSGNDFHFSDLRKKRMTIYVGIQMGDMARFERLNNLFFSQLITENTKELPSQNEDLKYQCLLLMDEFTSLGNMAIFEKGVAYIAGYNVRVLLIFQNMAQLNAAYTDNGARSLATNIACQIMYTPADIKDAEEFSKIIGYETYKAKSTSKGGGQKSGGQSVSMSDQQRAVLLPQELMELPASDCIINLRSVPKIRAEKIIYYKEKAFTKRLGCPIPDVPITPRGLAKLKDKPSKPILPKEQLDILTAVTKAMLPPGSSQSYTEAIRHQFHHLGGTTDLFNTLVKYA